LKHQEEKVRYRYGIVCMIVVVCLIFARPLLAQSHESAGGNWLMSRVTVVTATAVDDSELPDAPSASQDQTQQQEVVSPEPNPHRNALQGAPPAATGSLLGGYDRDVADRRYWTVTGTMFAASVVQAELAQRCLSEHTCSWVPDVLRSRKAMYGIGIPADLAISYLTYRLKRKHSEFWFVPAALVTGTNLFVAVHDFRRLR
jgi:hypothetical protein